MNAGIEPPATPSPIVSPSVGACSAFGSPAAHVRLWTAMLVGLAADLWTKSWAVATLTGNPRTIIPEILSFQMSYNRGALFGMGKGLAPVFVIASMAALVFVLYVFAKSDRRQRSFHLALGMVLAGALGNLYDRLFVGGKVRDFIKLELALGDLELWPWVFNIADVLLVCGVILLMLNIGFDRQKPSKVSCEREQASHPTSA